MEKTVIELFAGVGGFRVGLNKVKFLDASGKAVENGNFKFVWANQWEPSTKKQYAFECYKDRFLSLENEISNSDISLVNKKDIPDHTLLCGGFPCQDYSVARSLSHEKGIEGKKGVLWWQINDILKEKKPNFVLLENVDRLLKSPSKQRGRDFSIILRCFNDLGYIVEWRIINAADYSLPQRRRRIFIFAYRNTTRYGKNIKKLKINEVFNKESIFAKEFPIENIEDYKKVNIVKNYPSLLELSDKFNFNFENTGIMVNGYVYTTKTLSIKSNPYPLRNILEDSVDDHYYLDENKKKKFDYLRGSKTINRISKNGIKYKYSEGAMSKFDSLDLPGRTMLTSEGTVNRSTHYIVDKKTNKERILTPLECERLNQFPDNWTNMLPERKRYFMMGNALVCGIIEKLGNQIEKIIDNE